jgi:hypothetical protein
VYNNDNILIAFQLAKDRASGRLNCWQPGAGSRDGSRPGIKNRVTSGSRRSQAQELRPDQQVLVEAVARVIADEVTPLAEELDRLRAFFRQNSEHSLHIPPQRKYDINEVRIRLYTGRDPNTLADDERAHAEENALSTRTIERLVAAGHLERLVIGGSRLFSETQVQAYERRVAEGKVRTRAARRGGKRQTRAGNGTSS